MKGWYNKVLERELVRLWLHPEAVLVVSKGKDVFHITDGNRGVEGKGPALLKALKTLPSKSGSELLWKGLKDFKKVGKKRGL